VAAGWRPRDEVMAYLVQLFLRMKREPGEQWNALANACADVWPQEALDELNRAYREGLVYPGSISWKNIEQALALGREGCLQKSLYEDPLITDVAKDMSGLGWFRKPEQPEPAKSYTEPLKPVSSVNRSKPKIGRNDPCQCGSGKKFKKCCGAN